MNPTSLIQHNAREIAELHQRIHETAQHRDESETHRDLWRTACADFQAQYDSLAFPGGTLTARDRLRRGDTAAIEYALCFIEVRPYFFRSGYMYKDFVRVLKNCDLTERQRARYNRVRDAYVTYRRNRRCNQTSG